MSRPLERQLPSLPTAGRWAATAAGACAATVFSLLAAAFWNLPAPAGVLPDLVRESMPLSGVVNPVTAVVVNFRGYDTLIEVAVLLLTAVAARTAVEGTADLAAPLPEPMLVAFYRLLAPLIVVTAAYLLWVGKHAPGGAFQAGAMLAAAAVLGLFCTGGPPPRRTRRGDTVLCLGTLCFCIVGGGAQLSAATFLQYPVAWAGWLILLIEAGCTLSIAAALLTLFIACRKT